MCYFWWAALDAQCDIVCTRTIGEEFADHMVRDSEGQLLTMLKGDSQKECTADILTSTQDVFEICLEFHCAEVDAKLCNQQ